MENKVFVIAEAGVNHNGSLDNALKLVDIAKEAGADCVKFQTYIVENLINEEAEMADYQKANTKSEKTQYELLKSLCLNFDDFLILRDYCVKKGIMFLSTPFDLGSIDFLNDLGVKIWKIPSGEITNFPYLSKIGSTRKEVILSTGMCTLNEVGNAIEVLKEYGTKQITLLHCTTEYPAPVDEINLLAMKKMEKEFKVPIGYSDHSEGFEISLAAVAMGAVVIEKHFTIDKDMPGPDHKASLSPIELKEMVTAIRKIEAAMGSGEKNPTKSEMVNMNLVRKSIVASKDIKQGEILTETNVTVKRPGSGLSPMEWKKVMGSKAKMNFKKNQMIEI